MYLNKTVMSTRTSSDLSPQTGIPTSEYFYPEFRISDESISISGGHMFFFGPLMPLFGFLVTFPLGFKARVSSALFALFCVEANVMYILHDPPLVLHLPTS